MTDVLRRNMKCCIAAMRLAHDSLEG